MKGDRQIKKNKVNKRRFAEIYVFEQHGHGVNTLRQLAAEHNFEYEQTTLSPCASRFLRDPYTQECIKEFRQEAQKVYDINKAQIIEGLTNIATDADVPESNRISAYRALCDIAGWNEQNINLKANGCIEVSLEGFDKEDE